MAQIKKGSIVEYFPNNREDKKLPNGMNSAPGIITQIFGEDVKHANLTIFIADPLGVPYRQEWSVINKNHPANQSDTDNPYFE